MTRPIRSYLAYLGELQSGILLALTYLVVVFPVWAVLRLVRRDVLGARRSGWHRRSPPADPIADLRAPF